MTRPRTDAKKERLIVAATLDNGTFTLALPFPTAKEAKALGQNGRCHWRAKAAATKTMREIAGVTTRSTLPKNHTPWKRATLTYRIYWPDLRGRDFENYRAMFKPAIDGIVDGGLLVDDSWGVLVPGSKPVCELDRVSPRVEIVIGAVKENPDAR